MARSQGRSIQHVLDFSASINPLGLSPSVRRAIHRAISLTIHYPEIDAQSLRAQLAKFHRIPEECLIVGNGSAELISVIPRALGSRHGLVIGPTFMEFERALILAGARCTYVHATSMTRYAPPIDDVCALLHKQSGMREKPSRRGIHPIDTIFLCHPNSPTGQVISRASFHQLLDSVQQAGARLIVDEAFVDYCATRSVLRHVRKSETLLVLRSFTKFFAIPGLRLGYAAGPAKVVSQIRSMLPPWSVNALASAAAEAALCDTTYRRRSVQFMKQERTRFTQALRQIPGLRVHPSSANFLLVQLKAQDQVSLLTQELCTQGIVIRNCQNFAGVDVPTIRLAVRRPKENDRLVKAVKRELKKWS